MLTANKHVPLSAPAVYFLYKLHAFSPGPSSLLIKVFYWKHLSTVLSSQQPVSEEQESCKVWLFQIPPVDFFSKIFSLWPVQFSSYFSFSLHFISNPLLHLKDFKLYVLKSAQELNLYLFTFLWSSSHRWTHKMLHYDLQYHFPQVLYLIFSFSKLADLGYFDGSAAVESIYHAQTENLQWN